MAAQTHDLVVVGGGISGACIARDAARRGLRVALLEKRDFCHATSAASSKLIHGGLRYLKNFELGLVRESLRERRTWEIIAPHLVDPLPMLMPVFRRRGSPSKLMLRAGLTLYDLLAFDRNRLEDETKKIPGHTVLSREEALAAEPSLPTDRLVGAILYYDCQMYSPERLCLEHIIDAVEHGASVANYAEVTGLLSEAGAVRGVEVRDHVTGRAHEIRGAVTINASGPWADRLLAKLPEAPSSTRIIRSKGIHVITRSLTGAQALAIEHRGSHFFLLPWRGHTLIGTTDTIWRGDPDSFSVTEGDIAGLLATVNEGYPAADLRREDVVWFYGGLRPLVEAGGVEGDDTYSASRKAEVCDHAKSDGVEGFVSALGGKWTTSRHLAEQVLEIVGRKLGRALPEPTTAEVPLPGGATGAWPEFVAAAATVRPELAPASRTELLRNYGSRWEGVLRHAEAEPALGRPIAEGRAELAAQVVHAIREEMALHLDDVLFRRTGIGTLGHPGDATLRAVADLMAAELGWDAARTDEELAAVSARFVPARSPA